MAKLIRIVSIAFLAAFAATTAAQAQFGEPISGFNSDQIWLLEKPKTGAASAIRKLEKVHVSALGNVSDILITSYFPANRTVGLTLGDGSEKYVEYSSVEPVNEVVVAEAMGADVPPGTCISAASAARSADNNRKSGVRRGFGGC